MSGKTLTNKTFYGFLWSLLGKLAVAVIQIGVLAILARLISAHSFGIIQAALIVVGFAQIVSKIGIGPSLVQISNLTERHVKVGFTFSLLLGLLLSVIVIMSSGLIASFFVMTELRVVLLILSSLFIMEGFITVSSSLFQREMKLRENALIELISFVIGYGLVGVTLGYMGYDYWALVFGILGQSIVKLIAYTILSSHSFSLSWDKHSFNDLFKFAGGYTVGRVCSYFALQGDNIILGRFLGPVALGVYSRAYAIMTKPASMVGDAVNTALFPAMAAIKNEPDKLRRVFIEGSKIVLFISIICSFVIAGSAEEIVNVLLGNEWIGAILPLQILAAGLFFRLGYKLGAELSKATGNVNKLAFYYFLYAVATISGSLIGVRWGIVGVAFGTLFSIIVNYVFMTHLGLSILKVRWWAFFKDILPELIVATGLGILFLGISFLVGSLDVSDSITLMLSFSIYGCLLILLFYAYGSKMTFMKLLPFYSKIKKYMR